MKRKSPKYQHLIQIIIAIAALLVINLIVAFKFFRVDLTEDKIHTLNSKTQEYLEEEVDNVINVVIYLNGDDLPPILQKFRQQIKDKLDEFKAYAGNNIKYTFIDINEDPTLTKKYKETFRSNFVQPNLLVRFKDGVPQPTEFFPIVEIRHQTNIKFIDFMTDIIEVSDQYIEQQSNYIEYKFLTAFHQVSGASKNKIGFLRGHSELNNLELNPVLNQLGNFYILDTVNIMQTDSMGTTYEDVHALEGIDMLIVANPRAPISDKELFLIDQYIMQGGKVIWSVDMISDHEDSLMIPGKILSWSAPNNHFNNLEKMLYKYGAGIKKNFITNEVCAAQLRYDLGWNTYFVDNYNNTRKIESVINQWYPFACVTHSSSDLTKNLGRIKLKYPSPLNINEGAKSKKTIVLETDYIHRVWPAITRIRYNDRYIWDDLNAIEESGTFFKPIPNPNVAPTKLPLAVILEGEFPTNYGKNVLSPEFIKGVENGDYKYFEKSKPTSMMVIGDGNFIHSEVFMSQQGSLDAYNVGLDYKSPKEITYGNITFLHNCIDRMLGNDYLIPLRSRVERPRLLNSEEITYNKGKWKIINLLIPSIFVVILATTQWFIRRRKYIN